MVPTGVDVENPAFDVTPANLITAIITEELFLRKALLKDSRFLKANSLGLNVGNTSF